ncbi:hypothetical protein [Nitrobacter winogradskyi]|uniref:Uncharacterized protein n=2 Tax=Nitrobacter winogradskyi TaxID=913 RepID=A0A4Y3W8I3_NITWI|nr:hypothetical protein [Nitrobacter winogradskyi]MCP1998765.1 hypothetical protein [Nitrobacter winogradskyi]GEC14310.1 hypothetical protein NWI01_02020 [Nitrobacter winogradskyi]
MTTEERRQTAKTSMEIGQGEVELSALLLLTISTGLASLIICLVWLVFVHQ